MSKPNPSRHRSRRTTRKRQRSHFAVPELKLVASEPPPHSPPVEPGYGELVLLRTFAKEIGTTADALRQQICRGQLRRGVEVFKFHGRWYIDRRAFDRLVRRDARGAA